MHFSLPLIIAAASLCTAAPFANTEKTIVLEKRADVGLPTAFGSGQWMGLDQISNGVSQWCSQMNGLVVPQGKSLNAQISELITSDGTPGVLAAHYTNDKLRSGYTIDENTCNNWMMYVAQRTSDGTKSRGGYAKISDAENGDFGSIWVDPNAA